MLSEMGQAGNPSCCYAIARIFATTVPRASFSSAARNLTGDTGSGAKRARGTRRRRIPRVTKALRDWFLASALCSSYATNQRACTMSDLERVVRVDTAPASVRTRGTAGRANRKAASGETVFVDDVNGSKHSRATTPATSLHCRQSAQGRSTSVHLWSSTYTWVKHDQ